MRQFMKTKYVGNTADNEHGACYWDYTLNCNAFLLDESILSLETFLSLSVLFIVVPAEILSVVQLTFPVLVKKKKACGQCTASSSENSLSPQIHFAGCHVSRKKEMNSESNSVTDLFCLLPKSAECHRTDRISSVSVRYIQLIQY